MAYQNVTHPPEEKTFNGTRYSVEKSYPSIPSYPSTKPVAGRVAASFRKSGYPVRVVSFRLTTIGGTHPITKRVWYAYVGPHKG